MRFQDVVEIVLIDADGLDVFQRRIVLAQRVVTHHQQLQRQLHLGLGISGGRAIHDIDAFFRCYRPIGCHDVAPN